MGKKENLWQRFVAILMTLLLVLSTLSPMQVQAAYNPETLKDGDKSLNLRFWEDQKPDTGFYLNATSKYILEQVPTPVNGSIGGEWAVMSLLRGMYTGYDFINEIPASYFTGYIARNEQYVVDTISANSMGHLHNAKSTEYSRLMLALTALGYDVTNVGTATQKYDFLERLSRSHAYSYAQGINGTIWEVIALNTGGYPIYDTAKLGLPSLEEAQAQVTALEERIAALEAAALNDGGVADTAALNEELTVAMNTLKSVQDINTFGKMVDYTLNKQLENGGWALNGTTADPDITGMALQSLAPYYVDKARYESLSASKSYEEFKVAVERGVKVLADIQLDNGGYKSFGASNSESIAQVIVALTALNINPLSANVTLPTIGETVSFVKAGSVIEGVITNNMLDAILTFFVLDASNTPGVGGFKHIVTDSVNQMASEQALYALIAYERFKDGKNSLYDMSDMKNGEYQSMKAKSYQAKIGNEVKNYSPYAVIELAEGEKQDGKIFTSWNTKEDGTGSVYNISDNLVMPKHDITLYAQYDVDPNYAVTQVMDQITALPAHIQFTEEHKLALNAARAGYDALTEAQQELVTNYSELVEKENAYKATEESANTTVPLVSISFKDSEIGVLKDQTYQAEVIFNPANTTDDKTITWSSNKSYLISVDQNGVITPKTAGSATITAKTANGLTATMQVKTLIPLTDFNLDKTEYQINQSLTQTISTKFTPANTSDDKTITWSSSDENIATVDAKGNVTAVNLGTATITAKVGAFTRTATVKVIPYNPITSVTVSTEEVELDRGQTTTITTTYAPLDTTDSTVAKWSSSNSSVASVSQQGVITANARGTASITVKIGNISKKITVNVNDEVKGTVYVSFEDYAARVEGGEEFPEPIGTLIEKTAVPFYEGDSIADVTVRLLDQLGIIANYQGDTKDSFYLSSITDFTTPAGDYITGHNFGEFTAGQMSGWMISSNNWFINMGASAFEVEDGDIIRWQMTSQYGADIGSSYDNPSAEITGLNIDLKYGTLSPAFSEDKEEYTLTVPADVDAIQIEALQSNYWSIVTYTADGKQYKLLRDIPVEDGTEIEIYSAYAEYAGNPPSDEDWLYITIEKEPPAADEALQAVVDQILALPALITYDGTHKHALEQARAAYEALNDIQKALVFNYPTLVEKENAYKVAEELSNATVPLSEITVKEAVITLTVGDTHTPQVAFLPEDTTDSKALAFESSNASIVKAGNGVLTALSKGQATVTIKAANDLTATITVNVQEKQETPETPAPPVVDEILQDVINKIDALPMVITLDEAHKLALEEARASYNALSDVQKLLVSNYDVLQLKENAFGLLVEAIEKLEVLEEKPEVPEEKPEVSEEKPVVPEEKTVVPNVIPETPNDTGSVPVSPTNPAPKPVVPEEKPATLPTEMSKTEGKQQATVNPATNPQAAVVTVQSAEGIQISIPKAALQTESVDVVLQVAKQGLQINFEAQGQAVSLKKHAAIAIPAEVLSPKDGTVLLRRLPDGSLAAAPYTVVNGEFVLKTATSGEFVVSTASKTFKDIKNDGHKFYIEELAKRHIVNGKADEVYDPKEGVTRGQFSAMIVRAIDLQAGNEQQFSDAKANQFAQELQALVEIGVLKGDGNQLKPGATVTRHQAALMMERLFKHLEIDLPEVSDEELNFSDAEKIPEGSKQSIALMQKLGIFTGKDDGRFDPNGQLTRSQMSKVIYKALTYAKMM